MARKGSNIAIALCFKVKSYLNCKKYGYIKERFQYCNNTLFQVAKWKVQLQGFNTKSFYHFGSLQIKRSERKLWKLKPNLLKNHFENERIYITTCILQQREGFFSRSLLRLSRIKRFQVVSMGKFGPQY